MRCKTPSQQNIYNVINIDPNGFFFQPWKGFIFIENKCIRCKAPSEQNIYNV